jgi:hypothetical protein
LKPNFPRSRPFTYALRQQQCLLSAVPADEFHVPPPHLFFLFILTYFLLPCWTFDTVCYGASRPLNIGRNYDFITYIIFFLIKWSGFFCPLCAALWAAFFRWSPPPGSSRCFFAARRAPRAPLRQLPTVTWQMHLPCLCATGRGNPTEGAASRQIYLEFPAETAQKLLAKIV